MLSCFVEAATEQENLELKKGYLCDKLRHTVDPGEISTLVEQLHELDKGRRQSEVYLHLNFVMLCIFNQSPESLINFYFS